MPPTLDDVLEEIPVEYRDRFETLLDQPTATADALRAEVEAYIQTVRRVGPLVAFIDVGEAEHLAETTLALIGILRPDHPPLVHKIVQAATRYFVLEEDDDEVTGVLGFDDDIQVVNAICRCVGRPDLVVPLKRREI